ncbi:MAG: hypothetical protein M1459_00500 [Patescibacteria group bacterium]|nr:hypothetical protein [Patescibacteria group bacterium]
MNSNNRGGAVLWIVVVVAVIVAAMYFTKGFTFNSKPNPNEITDQLRVFLSDRYDNCTNASVTDLENINVGPYNKDTYGGFPVYATYKVTCASGNSNSSTSPTVAVAVAKRDIFGRHLLFVPKFVNDIQNQVNDMAAQYWKDHPIK